MEEKRNSSTALVIFLLFIFFPVGLYMMWRKTEWNNGLKVFLTIFFLIDLVFVLRITNSPEYKNDQQQAMTQSKQIPTPKPTEAIAQLSEAELLQEYDKNKLAAEDKFTNKNILTKGYIDNISYDITGKSYLLLKPNADLSGGDLQCYFDDKKPLLKLSKGDQVAVEGIVEHMTLGILLVKSCRLK